VVAVVLWVRNRDRFSQFTHRWFTLSALGLATYFLYPAAPPWWAAKYGLIEPVARISGRAWNAIGLHGAGNVLNAGQLASNPVAAMPSLHTAYATLVAGFFWIGKRWWQKALLACYPLAMGFALLYGGEHYLIDEIAGAAYALVVIAGWQASSRARGRTAGRPERRSSEPTAEPAKS
jgi:membrane-associated phospholipid phosphatase